MIRERSAHRKHTEASLVLMLTVDQHREVLARLVFLARRVERYEFRSAPYSNLMVSFLLHEMSSAESLLSLHHVVGEERFPVAGAYAIVRTMFETDVAAHYIGQDPEDRALQYIEFGHVLKKRQMDACARHMASANRTWAEGLALEWKDRWASVESRINTEHARIRSRFERRNQGAKPRPFSNWSGKSIRQMAEDVNHAEAYDVFYSDLSSFAHADVRLANRYLQTRTDGPVFSSAAAEYDVGAAFRYAAIFLSCFLGTFGKESALWSDGEVNRCWQPESA